MADFICKLVEVNEDLKLYDQMISDFTGGNEHMADVIVAVDEANTKGQDKIADGIQNITDGQADLAKTQVDFNDYSAELSESMKVIQDRLNSISKKIADAKLEEDAFVLAEDVLAIQKDLKSISQEMENLSDKTWMTPELQKSIEDALAMIDKMPEVDPEATKVATAEAVKSLQNSIEGYGNTVNSINQIYTNQMVPEINQLIDSMETTLVATKEMLAAIGNASGTLGNILESLNNTLDAANVTLGELQTVLRSTSDKLTTLIEELEGASTEEQMEMILNLLSGDPETLGNFFSEPVQVETNYIYEIANYGSGVAPFYTTLAIWVGMTILVSLIKVHADTEGLDHVKPYELFFGRYLLFFLLSQLQTGIIVLGNLFFFKIQCHYKLEFWIASAFASMTFSLLIYALTIAFGDIGKAAAVVIMVIQIAGSGGTYPIEALPSFFKAVYIFFPFPYAIDAMRECIGGMYQNHYGTCLLELGLFCVAALVIGLVIRIPFIKVNHFIEKRMKDTRML